MAKQVISVSIYEYDKDRDPKLMFRSQTISEKFAPEHVAGLMTFVTGAVMEEEDHNLLNNLHTQGMTRFKFGPDWEWYVEAHVLDHEE